MSRGVEWGEKKIKIETNRRKIARFVKLTWRTFTANEWETRELTEKIHLKHASGMHNGLCKRVELSGTDERKLRSGESVGE